MRDEIEVRHLRYFVAVTEERHFGHAARALGITQPVLSRQIRVLEKLLGIPLFASTRPSLVLTPEGQSFFEEARIILQQIDRATRSARQSRRKESLSVAYEPCSAFHGFVLVAQQLRNSMPHLRLDIQQVPISEHTQRLRSGEIDIAYGHRGEAADGISYQVLSSEPLMVVLASKHRLARRRVVDLLDLQDDPFVFWHRAISPACHDLILGYMEKAGVKPTVKHSVSDHAKLLDMVAGGAGWSVTPACARGARHPGLSFRAIRGVAAKIDFGISHLTQARDRATRELVKTWTAIYKEQEPSPSA